MASAERSLVRTSFFVSETTTAFLDLVEAANFSVEQGFSFGLGGGESRGRRRRAWET
jgi:hypothetical protein